MSRIGGVTSIAVFTAFIVWQIIDRGIALRKNLCLPQSQTASTILHGLQAGDIYSFTVSCVAEVEGALRHVSILAQLPSFAWMATGTF